MDDKPRKSLTPQITLLIATAIMSLALAIGLCALIFMQGSFSLPIPHRITYRVTGSAAQATITYDIDGESYRHENEALPFERTITVYGLRFDAVLDVYADDSVSCEILIDGQSLVIANGVTNAACTAEGDGSGIGSGGYGNSATVQP